MSNINLTNEEKFKLAVQLAQGLISDSNAKTSDSITKVAKKNIIHSYNGIESALEELSSQ